MARIPIDVDKIADFCRRHHIRRLSLFGSVLRDDFGPECDVDVLVEFEPGHTPGLSFFAMEEELSQIIGRKVDLNTSGFLSPYFSDRIERDSEVQYVTAELMNNQIIARNCEAMASRTVDLPAGRATTCERLSICRPPSRPRAGPAGRAAAATSLAQ